jgi:DnaJ-class molecular chaperone
MIPCLACEGNGWLRFWRTSQGRDYSTTRVCERCWGIGRVKPFDGVDGKTLASGIALTLPPTPLQGQAIVDAGGAVSQPGRDKSRH